jgi:hypothetical protein
MLAFLFERAGIDYRQFCVLSRAFLRRDFRASSMSATLRHGRTGKRTFLVLLFFYLTSGLIFIPVVLSIADAFLSATLLMTYTMFMIGGLIMVEYYSIVIAPEDYHILGFQPVSSRTFMTVKMANVLFYVLIFSMILALPGITTLTFAAGFQPQMFIVAFVAVFFCNCFVATVVIVLYVVLLKKVRLQSLQNVLALFQVGLAFLIYSSFFILPRLSDFLANHSHTWKEAVWLHFLPASWFARSLNIASGSFTAVDWYFSVFALLLLVSVGGVAISRLSLGYARQLARLSQDKPVGQRRRFSPMYLFANANEERVVAKLIRIQFFNDNKFKMAVLGILPLTMFYLFLGVEEGPLSNPFEDPDIPFRSGLLYLLVFLFPMMLRTYVTCSDSYQSSWIFHATPVDKARIVLAEKNFLMIYFVLPFLFLLSGVFYYFFDNLLHVLLHSLLLGLLAHMFLQFAFLYAPDLPFSRPDVKGARTLNMAMLLIFVPFLIYMVLPAIFEYIYSNTASYITFTTTILIISIILENLIQVRVLSYQKKVEFLG